MNFTCKTCGAKNDVNPAALLGSMTSKAKKRASKANGKLGGYPKWKKRKKGATLSSNATR